MANLQQKKFKAVIRSGDQSGYVAECVEIAVVTQGRTLDDTVANLREAVGFHLEGESSSAFGLRNHPTLLITFEPDPTHAQAS